MIFRIYLSDDGRAADLVGEVEFSSVMTAVGFCYDNWDKVKGEKRPPFEIQYPDGHFFIWSEDNMIDEEEKPKTVVLSVDISCSRCDSHRIASVSAHCSDLCSFALGDIDHDGYVPYDVGIGGGDDVEMDYCLDCGQMQGTFPLPISPFEKGQ